MTWAAAAVVGGATVLTGYLTAQERARAQRQANQANVEMSEAQIEEGARQFDVSRADEIARFETVMAGERAREERAVGYGREREGYADERSTSRRTREDEINRQIQERFGTIRGENLARLDPYAEAGSRASAEQEALLGLSGVGAERAAISRMTESPGQQFLRERQERATLRTASATGGLRGGNVQRQLQEEAFGRASTRLDTRVERLGRLSERGLSSAQIAAGMGTGPSYVTTGVDLGVRSGDTEAATREAEAAARVAEGGRGRSGGSRLPSRLSITDRRSNYSRLQ